MDDKATAAKIVADHMNSVCETSMESAIVAALEAARRESIDGNDVDLVAPEPTWTETPSAALLRQAKEIRGIIDCTGEVPVVCKVTGALPKTADGVVVCYASTPLWHPVLGQMDTLTGEPFAAWRDGMGKRTSECYITPEAAKAAMEGGKQ
jgi:hypothetical protein